MHIRHNRRGPPRSQSNGEEEKRGWRRDDVLEARQLNGPVTLTVTVVRQSPSSSSAVPTVTLPGTTALPTTAVLSLPTSVSDTSVLSSPLPQTSSSAITSVIAAQPTPLSPVASATTPSASPSDTKSVPKIPDSDGNPATTNPVTLSSGAIVGIVIGCLVVLLVAVLVGLRKRTVRNRLKLRGVWVQSKAMALRGSLRPTPYNYNPHEDSTLNGSMSFAGQPVSAKMNMNDAVTVVVTSPQALPSAYGAEYSPNSVGLSPRVQPVLYTAYVARSFVVTLPDELSISIGQMLKVLQVFDDGWAECMTLEGEAGMVPTECFERRSGDGTGAASPMTSAGSVVGEDIARNSRRYSSLPSARQ